MFSRINFGDQGQYAAWVAAERLEGHAPGALTVEQVKSKLGNIKPAQLDAILAARKEDLEKATTNGPLRLFPEDQWESLLLGPGIDGPSGEHTFVGFSQETVNAAHRSLTWHSLPTEDRTPESYFVFGEGQVLVPRLPNHQPSLVRNPFQSASNLPFPPPPPFVPHARHAPHPHTSPSRTQLPTQTLPASTQTLPPALPARRSIHGLVTASTPSHPQQNSQSYPGHNLPLSTTKPQSISGSSSHTSPHASQSNAQISHTTVPKDSHRSSVASSSMATTSSHRGHSLDSQKRRSVRSPDMATGEYGSYHGDSEQARAPGEAPRCPDEVNGYCRSWNVMHQSICPYSHMYWSEANDPTGFSSKYKYTMTKLSTGSPEFDYIKIRFINSWIHVQARKPTVTKIKQVSCPLLERLFNKRQEEIAATGVKPNVTELYHGTCEANFATLFTQGFQPPADYAPHPQCPVSGPYADKLTTSLCKRTCRLCTSMPRHCWNVCHMWGLGIYCAIDSSKSDIYVSNKKGKKTDRTKRKMLLCSVILGEAENVKQLKTPSSMHDRIAPAPGKHSIFAVGWKTQAIPTKDGQTLGVLNDEYIVFHPHQIMPLYVIEYSK